ncbi:MAG: hypothetical protein PHU75_03825 [Candidatus Nanopelagicales bacterium]|nr:hypothetical protein [Candidatus Nanopelagicales bacterium]
MVMKKFTEPAKKPVQFLGPPEKQPPIMPPVPMPKATTLILPQRGTQEHWDFDNALGEFFRQAWLGAIPGETLTIVVPKEV